MEFKQGDRVRVEGDNLYPDFTGTVDLKYHESGASHTDWGDSNLWSVRPDKSLVSIGGLTKSAGSLILVWEANITLLTEEE